MVKFRTEDLFDVVCHAQNAGLLELCPSMKGEIKPGDRFFESFQRYLLDTYDLEQVDELLYRLAPTIQFMADEKHWEPAEFSAEQMFDAVLHLQQLGFFEVVKPKFELPGSGDRFFEYYQDILVNKVGVEKLEQILHILGQGICFLATDAAMMNM